MSLEPSKRSRLGAAVAPTLTGLSLAASIAREAADAVPVVKQALGVVVRILALAEKIDADRDALHALADKSARLALRVRDVLGNDVPDPKLLPSLERAYKAFQDVEAFMAKHIARNRLSRGLSYAFTVNHHVDRLSRSMENALQEIFAVTLLAIKQDAQYDGEFRRIRGCEVDRLDFLGEDKYEHEGSDLVVQYHSARIDGRVLVVRYCEGTRGQDRQAHEEVPYDHIASHDRMLGELSSVQTSHRNIARIYGWGKGSMYNRFTVFKSGYRPVHSVVDDVNPLTTAIHWVIKLLDAIHHLNMRGIAWTPHTIPSHMLDDQLEPTIGLNNDLSRIDQSSVSLVSQEHFTWITWLLPYSAEQMNVTPAEVLDAAADCHKEQFSKLLGRAETLKCFRHRSVIRKADFSHGRVLNNSIAKILHHVVDEDVFDPVLGRGMAWEWAIMLLALNKRLSRRIKHLDLVYDASSSSGDSINLYSVIEDSEDIVYNTYTLDIPVAQRTEVREMFGIPEPSKDTTMHLIR